MKTTVQTTAWVRYTPGETVVDPATLYAVFGPEGGRLVRGKYLHLTNAIWILQLPDLPLESP